MPRKSHLAGKLPQLSEIWHVAVEQLRIWITPPDEEPSRPFVVMILNLTMGLIQKMELVANYPSPAQLLEILFQAMQEPPQAVGQKRHRPQEIQIEAPALAEALVPELEKIDIRVQQYSRPEEVDQILNNLELHLRGKPENPGLLSVKGVTPELVGGLFAAAAEFYRAAPWIHLNDQQTLAIHVPPEQSPRFVQVMGNAGVEYGLAMYRRWEDVERIFSFTDHPLEVLAPEGGHSFIFDEVSKLPFDDLEAIERYGWEVAGKQAYPIPIVYTRQAGVRRPDRADLIWYEAALRAIPRFVRDHLRSDPAGDYLPAEVILSVPTHAGETSVEVKYPAGKLAKETRPVHLADWSQLEAEDEERLPEFDRRAMEGMMAEFGEGFDDPELEKAQQLMYQAWDEQNPARRIILAREALSISTDCADAYVLLAEEEADTLGRALEYYRQGVEAGERALGPTYFAENVGYFWGLLETRPYMRARQGLANTLWELGRTQEAVSHFRELLRLNPGDNQGIRYSLLNLLLSMNDEAAAGELLKEYEDDGMAEWLYTRALLAFRQGGDSPAAAEALQAAMAQNRYVPAYLTGRKRVPAHMPPYMTWGGEDEAAIYAFSYLPYWRRTPGAVEWVQTHLKSSPRTRSKTRRSSQPRQGRKKRRSSRK